MKDVNKVVGLFIAGLVVFNVATFIYLSAL